ncbi:MAG: hypothetical protein E7471_06465 [Ruminococcaceae bacterium]|nr:hypothetical protein [Oscillospiraceae bacterium]
MGRTRNEQSRGTNFTLCAYVICFTLLLAMIFSYVKLNEISDQSIRLQSQLEDLQEQNQLLTVRIGQRLGRDQIKQQAAERFGMVTLSKDQVTYVNTNNTDTVEIISETELLRDRSQIVAGLARGFRWLVEYIN